MSKAVKSVCLSDHTLVLQYHLLVWLFLEATFAQRKMVIIFLPNFSPFTIYILLRYLQRSTCHSRAVFCAVFMGDTYFFHLDRFKWANLTGPLIGSPPTARINHGFTRGEDDVMYSFGGLQPEGELCLPPTSPFPRENKQGFISNTLAHH